MTITGTYVPDKYNVTAAQKDFNISFEFVDDSHIAATVTDQVTGADKELVPTTDFTISGTTLTTVAQQTVDDQLTIYLDMPLTQTTDYKNTGDLDLDNIEDDYDKAALERQQLQNAVDRSVKVAITGDTDPQDLIDELTQGAADAVAAAAAASASEAAAAASEAQTIADAASTAADAIATAAGVISSAANAAAALASKNAAETAQGLAETAQTAAEAAQTAAEAAQTAAEAAEAEVAADAAAAAASAAAAAADAAYVAAQIPDWELVNDTTPALGGTLTGGGNRVDNVVFNDVADLTQNLGSISGATAINYSSGQHV
ncbi:MAG: hypothetical protein GY753_12010, partial [Gammaproteobacteria bacterium]|nr:hypothetical protein [Gammaproteobacteria bacterium]